MEKQTNEYTNRANRVENEIDQAVREIYKKYGSDLSTSPMQRERILERQYEPPHGAQKQRDGCDETDLDQTESKLSSKSQARALHQWHH